MQATPSLLAPPPPPAAPVVGGMNVVGTGSVGPAAVYQGFAAQRHELGNQLESLQETRSALSEKLGDPMVRGLDRVGLESRISALDGRIAALDRQIADADAQVARAAAVPGAVVQPPAVQYENQVTPDGAFVVGGLFIVVVMLPISLAFARRIWRRGTAAVAAIPAELMERMSRVDQAVESIAIEVERIGEGQRFMTRLFTEQGTSRVLGAGAAEPVRQPARDATPVRER